MEEEKKKTRGRCMVAEKKIASTDGRKKGRLHGL